MRTTTLLTGGRLVIPSRFRQVLHLHSGDEVTLSLEGEKLILQRNAPGHAKLVRGRFGRPVLVAPTGAPSMTPERVRTILNERQ